MKQLWCKTPFNFIKVIPLVSLSLSLSLNTDNTKYKCKSAKYGGKYFAC